MRLIEFIEEYEDARAELIEEANEINKAAKGRR